MIGYRSVLVLMFRGKGRKWSLCPATALTILPFQFLKAVNCAFILGKGVFPQAWITRPSPASVISRQRVFRGNGSRLQLRKQGSWKLKKMCALPFGAVLSPTHPRTGIRFLSSVGKEELNTLEFKWRFNL